MLKLSLADRKDDFSMILLLRKEAIELKAMVEELRRQKEGLQRPFQREEFPTWLLTLDYGIASAEARLQWCEQAITNLEGRSDGNGEKERVY
nr:hypothetical protein [Paenibacillus turpanensis]